MRKSSLDGPKNTFLSRPFTVDETNQKQQQTQATFAVAAGLFILLSQTTTPPPPPPQPPPTKIMGGNDDGDNKKEQELKQRLMRRKSERDQQRNNDGHRQHHHRDDYRPREDDDVDDNQEGDSRDNTNPGRRDEFGRTVINSSRSSDRRDRGRDNYGRDHERRRRHHSSSRRDDQDDYNAHSYGGDDDFVHIRNGGRKVDDGHYYGPGGAAAAAEERVLHPGLVVKGEVVRIESYGAFVQFKDELQHQHRGLVHISQLATYRVENVTDILKLNQTVQCVILEVEDDQRMGKRIRLSMKDVNQETGLYTGNDLRQGGGHSRGGRGGRPLPARQLTERAEKRRQSLVSLGRDWKDENGATTSSRSTTARDVEYLRKLWSASPEPPQSKQAPKGGVVSEHTKKKSSSSKNRDDHDDDESSTGSESSSSSSSSSSASSSHRRRRRSSRKRNSRSKSRRDAKTGSSSRRSRRDKSRSRHRSRRRSPSSSSSSSNSDSESSSSSSSTSGSSSSSSSNTNKEPETKRPKLDPAEYSKKDIAGAETNTDLTEIDLKDAQEFKQAVQGKASAGHGNDEYDDDEEEGPMPLPQVGAGGTSSGGGGGGDGTYGKALLPGEGQAIAQYVQQNLRIPRRGEIGYSGDDIDHFEKSGYVMSGSRHARMNAVRIRKENQVYSAEEQRALALLTMEENQQKEAQLMEDFRTMLKEKQKAREGK